MTRKGDRARCADCPGCGEPYHKGVCARYIWAPDDVTVVSE